MVLMRAEVMEKLLKFRNERDWQKFHTPRNLAASISIEAAELLECFQWARDDEIPGLVERERGSIEDEIADMAILLGYLCHDLGIDPEVAVERKLQKNEAKYPVHLARGIATKYDKL